MKKAGPSVSDKCHVEGERTRARDEGARSVPAISDEGLDEQAQDDLIRDPGDWDVLMGRGAPSTDFPGNMRFRNLVKKRRHEYINAKRRMDKQGISGQIVATVRAHGGRFLERVDVYKNVAGCKQKVTMWKPVNDRTTLLVKVKQLMRDVGPQARCKKNGQRNQMRKRSHELEHEHAQLPPAKAQNPAVAKQGSFSNGITEGQEDREAELLGKFAQIGSSTFPVGSSDSISCMSQVLARKQRQASRRARTLNDMERTGVDLRMVERQRQNASAKAAKMLKQDLWQQHTALATSHAMWHRRQEEQRQRQRQQQLDHLALVALKHRRIASSLPRTDLADHPLWQREQLVQLQQLREQNLRDTMARETAMLNLILDTHLPKLHNEHVALKSISKPFVDLSVGALPVKQAISRREALMLLLDDPSFGQSQQQHYSSNGTTMLF